MSRIQWNESDLVFWPQKNHTKYILPNTYSKPNISLGILIYLSSLWQLHNVIIISMWEQCKAEGVPYIVMQHSAASDPILFWPYFITDFDKDPENMFTISRCCMK